MDILRFEKYKKMTYKYSDWPEGMIPLNIDLKEFQWRWSLFINNTALKEFFIRYEENDAYVFWHIKNGYWVRCNFKTLQEAKYTLINTYHEKIFTPKSEYYCPF